MRSADYILAAVMTVGAATAAAAQSTAPLLPATPQATNVGQAESHWMAAAFVGSEFGTNGDNITTLDASNGGITYGGQVGYLWRGIVGPEFIADFAPTFDVADINIDSNRTRV